MHAFTYGASHVAARIALTKSTHVGSHMRGNVYDNMSKTAHVNSHMRALLLPCIHSHVNSGRTCEFTCGACGVLKGLKYVSLVLLLMSSPCTDGHWNLPLPSVEQLKDRTKRELNPNRHCVCGWM